MSTKLIWTGLAVMLALDKLIAMPSAEFIGALVMAFGVVLLWLDK